MRRLLRGFLVTALFLCLASWLAWRRFFVVPPAFMRNPQLDSRAVAEIEDYAQPRYRHVIECYLRDLDAYSRLHMADVSPASDPTVLARQLLPVLNERFREDSPSAAILSKRPPGLARSLSGHVALLIVRCAGLPSDEYLRMLGPTVALRLPTETLSLQMFCQALLPGVEIPSEGADQAAMRLFFKRVYAVAESHRSGSNRAVAWTDETQGVFAVLDEIAGPDAYADIEQVDSRFVLSQRLFFKGKLTTGSLAFTRPIEAKSTTEPTPPVLRSQVAIVVRTAGNDFFPVHFHSYYDRTSACWRLLYVNRHVSPRMATSPMMAF